MLRKPAFLLSIISLLLIPNLFSQTSIEKLDSNWILYVDDKPFEVKGVTFGYDSIENFDFHFKDLKFLGVNTIRTWGTNENTIKLLDAAHAHQIKVILGIWMRHGRPGMEDDDRFNYLEDKEGMDRMYKDAIAVVNRYKDHPAVLIWGVGNEVYLNMSTDEEKEAYSNFLEKTCSAIKSIDPKHPIASIEAWTFGLEWWQKFVPSIDIYGLNAYGPGANLLDSELRKRDIDKAYIITEYGVIGEWDIKTEKYGVKIEPNDQQKYDAIVDGYNHFVRPKPSCLGICFFNYANGKNFISPWLFTHHNGHLRPQYWAIREAFTGNKPINNPPIITKFELPEIKIKSGKWVEVLLESMDEEKENLSFQFFYNQRTGSRKRRDQINALEHRVNKAGLYEIKLPEEHGAIKVYVNVIDEFGNVGIASTAIQVIDKNEEKRKFQVPKVDLPFYVYRDGENMPYLPTGYMGNFDAIKVDTRCDQDQHSGSFCMKISYNAKEDWYGLALVDPPNDWGEILGGYNLENATKLTFWAKANDSGIKAKIGFGLIDNDKTYPDTGKKSKEIILSKEWKQYTISVKNIDLSCIRSGFVIFSSADGFEQEIFIDDVVFE